jgi:hypothetical protein
MPNDFSPTAQGHYSIDIRVADSLAAVLTGTFTEALVQKWMIGKVLEKAADDLGQLIADELNKMEGKES